MSSKRPIGERLRERLRDYVATPPKNGATSGQGDDRVEVEVTPNEHEVLAEVTDALGEGEELLQRDGVVLCLSETEAPAEKEAQQWAKAPTTKLLIRRPPRFISLRTAPPAFIRQSIASSCYLFKWSFDKKEDDYIKVQVHPPAWLPAAVQAKPGAIKVVDGILPGPSLDATGRLISQPGYNQETRWFLTRSMDDFDIFERVSLDEAKRSARILLDLVQDFPFLTFADRVRWLCLLLTACCRHLISRTPLGLFTANQAGSGKTRLANLISITAHGLDSPITMSWPEGAAHQSRGDEIRKRLASLLHEGASLVLLDNIHRGEDFGGPEIDGFLTADAYHDRQLGRNDGARVGGLNRCLLLATGNHVAPYGDTADRTLLVRLQSSDPNPRSRDPNTFKHPRIEEYTLEHRRRYLGAALTIWRAWIYSGCPQPPGPSWGSFEDFHGKVIAIVRWLGLPDPIADRVQMVSETDREGLSLVSLIGLWGELLGTDPIGCGEILGKLDQQTSPAASAFREALQTLGCGGRWPPTPQRLGKVLRGYLARVVEVGAEKHRLSLQSEFDSDVKVNRYFISRQPNGVYGVSGVTPPPAGESTTAERPPDQQGANPGNPVQGQPGWTPFK
jgi:hypothetical protein